MSQVALAIDFGNIKLRIGVRYNGKLEIIKNEESYSSFSQMLIAREKSLSFGIEAEKNYAGNYDNCYKEFKYNILKINNKTNKTCDHRVMKSNQDFSFFSIKNHSESMIMYHQFIIDALNYYKTKSEDFVRSRFDENIKNINDVYLTIPLYDANNKGFLYNFFTECSKKAGFKNAFIMYEETAAISYYVTNISNHKNPKFYCLISLGSLFFVSTVSNGISSLVVSKCPLYERIDESNGGRNFFPKLQNFFDQKLKQYCENIVKRIFTPEFKSFEKCFNKKIFTENKKYLAECYKKYHVVLNSFSGEAKSIQLEFRHILDDPIEIEITRDEINKVLEETLEEIQKIIDDTKKYLQHKSSFILIIIGNGFRFPGVKDLFIKEFPQNFHQRHVFYDEEIIKGALQTFKL
jgi:molecular chaperone DnaK (HSP70)